MIAIASAHREIDRFTHDSTLSVARIALTPDTRTPRSAAYMLGMHSMLEHRQHGGRPECTHAPGTTEHDAFYAGVEEGRTIWAQRLEAVVGATHGIRIAAPNAADVLAGELLRAGEIIDCLWAALAPLQHDQVVSHMAAAGISRAADPTRHHKRSAALVATGFALPDSAEDSPNNLTTVS